MLIHFFELSGFEAKEKLNELRDTVSSMAGVMSIEFLESQEQADLFLLVIKSHRNLNLIPPEGTRVWAFKEVVN